MSAPTGRPAKYGDRVNTNMRLPRELHERLVIAAEERCVSVNWLVERAVADFVDRLIPADEIVLTRPREAIRAHKREFYGNVNYDDAPTANDEALWAAIEDVAPTPPQPRNGGLLSCGCWAYVMPGMRAGRDTFECPRHGRQIIDRCNVDEPSPSTGEDGGHG